MASRMGPGRFLPVNVATDRNITAYAVRGDDGRTRIAVIEKDGTSAAPVRVSVAVGRQSGTAEVVRLTGTSLESKEGVAIQGATVDRRGRLARRPGDRVRIHQGTLTVDVASGSAAIITLERGC